MHRTGCTAINGDGVLMPGRARGSTRGTRARIRIGHPCMGNMAIQLPVSTGRRTMAATVTDALVGLCVLEIPYVKSLSKSSD